MGDAMNTSIVAGSVADIAKKTNTSIAESFLNCDVMVIVDVSGSMNMPDSRRGQSRYEIALEELAQLQASMPGKIAVVGFSDTAELAPSGKPRMMGSGTDLAGALRFARMADGHDMRFVVVSDGIADEPEAAISVARGFEARIDTIFVGPESDREGGRLFLQHLAAASGGQSVTADCAQDLAEKVTMLLLHA